MFGRCSPLPPVKDQHDLVAFPLPVCDQEFNELFPLCLEVPVRDADEVVSVDDEEGNRVLL
jgi:hypothetical protein